MDLQTLIAAVALTSAGVFAGTVPFSTADESD